MDEDDPAHLASNAEAVLLALSDAASRSPRPTPVGIGQLATLSEVPEAECWTVVRQLHQLGLAVAHDAGAGRSLANAASLTEPGQRVALSLGVVIPKGPVAEFTLGIDDLKRAVLDTVVENELRRAGGAATRSHVRTVIRNGEIDPKPSIGAVNEVIDGLIATHLLASGGVEPHYRIGLLGLLASSWGTNALETIEQTLELLRSLKQEDPGLIRYSWRTLRKAHRLPGKMLNLVNLTISLTKLGQGLFRSDGDDWWATPPDLDVALEVEGALEVVRKIVESGTCPGLGLTPGEFGTPHATGTSTPRPINTVIPVEESNVKPDPKKVFIIHGRNLEARKEMGVFVRSLGLAPINFSDVRSAMGGTPTVADIVERGMSEAQGIIALITADEYAAVRPEYRYDHDDPDQIARWQARPNVLFEAGMAFGRDRKRVVFVLLGNPKLFTDVAGVHVLRPTNDSSGDRAILRGTLAQGIACQVEPHSTDWMTAGDFEGCVAPDVRAAPQDPFVDPTPTVERAAGADGSPMFHLTRDAQNIVKWLTEQYLDAGYPSHGGWSFSPDAGHRTTFAELRAHGLIKTMGSGGNWVLTDAGHALVMALIASKRA